MLRRHPRERPGVPRGTARPWQGKRRGRQPRRVRRDLLLRLSTRKQDVLRFLTDPSVPFTDNLAERDGSMMKFASEDLQRFRAQNGAKDFAVIRSVLGRPGEQGWNMFGP